MYNEVVKKVIDDLVSINGFDLDDKSYLNEIKMIEEKINSLSGKKNLTEYEEEELGVLKSRKLSWEKSAIYLGNEVLNMYNKRENSSEIKNKFDNLFSLAIEASRKLTNDLEKDYVENVWDAIEKNTKLLKEKESKKDITIEDGDYSSLLEFYEERINLFDKEIVELDEYKQNIVSVLSEDEELLEKINQDIENNAETLAKINTKRYEMANRLMLERDYNDISAEIERIKQIRSENLESMRIFSESVETLKKEIKEIEEKISSKQKDKSKMRELLNNLSNKYEEEGFDSQFAEIREKLSLIELVNKISKFENQKYTSYLDLEQMKSLFYNVIKEKNLSSAEKEQLQKVEDSIQEESNFEDESLIEDQITNEMNLDDKIKDIKEELIAEPSEEEINEIVEKYALTAEEAKEYLLTQ